MPKMKSNRALCKRLHVTGSGKLKRYSSHISHQCHHKTHKQKMHLRKPSIVSLSDYKRVKYMIQK